MRKLALILLLLPLPALAWDYNDAPLIVVDHNKTVQPKASAPMPAAATPTRVETAPVAAATPAGNVTQAPGFPEWAVTNAAQNTAGNTNPMPGQAPQAAQAPVAGSPQNAAGSAAPAAPASPASPATKLWPRDTAPIFVKSCAGLHIELVPACGCVIGELMLAMPHDEFLALSADGSIERDARLLRIREQCIATPQRKE